MSLCPSVAFILGCASGYLLGGGGFGNPGLPRGQEQLPE